MAITEPALTLQGTIIRYPYLWLSQAPRETEGRKSRPACVIISVLDSTTGFHHLAILAISSKPPASNQRVIEIPDFERNRAGLGNTRSWIYTGEYNYDVAEKSYYLDINQVPVGKFSTRFIALIARDFKKTIMLPKRRVNRT